MRNLERLIPDCELDQMPDESIQDGGLFGEFNQNSSISYLRCSKSRCRSIMEGFWSRIYQEFKNCEPGEMLDRTRHLHYHIATSALQKLQGISLAEAHRTLLELMKGSRLKISSDLMKECSVDDEFTSRECILDMLHEEVIVPLTTALGSDTLSRAVSLHALRKRTGSFYTPSKIAQYISNQTMLRWLEYNVGFSFEKIPSDNMNRDERIQLLSYLNNLRILDPSVGAGVFLFEAGNWILRMRRLLGDELPIQQMKQEIVMNNLYGVDILPDSVFAARLHLALWASPHGNPHSKVFSTQITNNVRQGNSLIGRTPRSRACLEFTPDDDEAFHWDANFPKVFDEGGFDVILGNPPYGRIISEREKRIIVSSFRWNVTGGRFGSWNAACLFLARSRELLKTRGHLGFLLPNSILRVGQFKKTRDFVLKEFEILEICDEARPIEGITLEMFSLISRVRDSTPVDPVLVTSKRDDVEHMNLIPRESLRSSDIFVLYYDEILELARKRGRTRILSATRGRDIPAEHVRRMPDDSFHVPYATSGRSILRYRFDTHHLRYADDWFRSNSKLKRVFENEFLIATKNLPYPRVLLKPTGVIHGGGVVHIKIRDPQFDEAAIGMILNSNLIRFLCIRYLTNYSELTTCLNTGIMGELPIVYPECSRLYSMIFREIQQLHFEQRTKEKMTRSLDTLANALVYEAYVLDDSELANEAMAISEMNPEHLDRRRMIEHIVTKTRHLVNQIMTSEIPLRIENSTRMR